MARRPLTDTERYHLHALMGQALWSLQFAEDALVTYLTMCLEVERGIGQQEGLAALARERRKHTLGALVRRARDAGLIADELERECDSLVKGRNWLVHHSLHECGDQLYTHEGRETFAVRLVFLHEDALRIQSIVGRLVKDWCAAQGFDVAASDAAALAQWRQLRGDIV